jgi:septal ring factor EnvC (AmiA/AmiB activator)
LLTQDHEIARLNSLLANRKKDIQILEDQNRSYQRELEEVKKMPKDLENSKKKISNYEEKIVLLSQ